MSRKASANITRSEGKIARETREQMLGQRGCVVWFTGLSGAGKSTVSRALEERLIADGRLCYVLDGDNLRHGLNSDLGFEAKDRHENIRRIAELSALFVDAGLIVITAFISPYRADRELARRLAGRGRFVEVHLDVPLDVCESRDPKGLYRKARAGAIKDFTGIDHPYEKPENPEVTIKADMSVVQNVQTIVDRLRFDELLAQRAQARSVSRAYKEKQ
jgi:adenylylsulfate kinase